MIGKEPICLKCKHFINDNEIGFRCSAYLDGIPDVFITSLLDHTDEYPGDNGIRFEPIKKEDAND